MSTSGRENFEFFEERPSLSKDRIIEGMAVRKWGTYALYACMQCNVYIACAPTVFNLEMSNVSQRSFRGNITVAIIFHFLLIVPSMFADLLQFEE